MNVNLHFHIDNVHIHVKDEKQLKQISETVNFLKTQNQSIIMTQQEAIDKLNGQATQLAKVRAEVQKLVDAAANAGNISPELEAAINGVSTAIQGVDDLNADEVVNPGGDNGAGTTDTGIVNP